MAQLARGRGIAGEPGGLDELPLLSGDDRRRLAVFRLNGVPCRGRSIREAGRGLGLGQQPAETDLTLWVMGSAGGVYLVHVFHSLSSSMSSRAASTLAPPR